MINLITDRWMPVARRSGAVDTVRPSELTGGWDDDPIVALAFPRPDWNGAVTEFLIGLHAVAMPVEDRRHWVRRWRAPPTADEVAEAMAPLALAFEVAGEGPRCFQDIEPLEKADVSPIERLLVNGPGKNALDTNQDLFVRRRLSHVLPWAHAAAALITLQTYAPSGGRGWRTSIRGGGPLTTLVRPRRADDEVRLFDLVHANAPRGHERPAPDARLFAWLGRAPTSEKGKVTTPEDLHPLHAFFGVPRRLRLEGDEAGAASFRTLPNGTNYPSNAWAHPLSPYYEQKGEHLPYHPQPGQPTYRDWTAALALGGRPAACVAAWDYPDIKKAADADLLAYGYDMDNAKARAWHEQRAPLLLDEGTRAATEKMIDAAGEAAGALRFAVKRARYGQARPNETGYEIYLPDTVPKRACAEVGTALELSTEGVLRALVELLQEDKVEASSVYLAWHRELRGVALRLFDCEAGVGAVATDDLPLIVRARGALAAAFSARGKVAGAMAIKERLKASAQARETAEAVMETVR